MDNPEEKDHQTPRQGGHHHAHHHRRHHGGGGGGGASSGTKRDRAGYPKSIAPGSGHGSSTRTPGGGGGGPSASAPRPEVPRNAYTSMFEGFRDEIDAHHDRRERVIKASRDVTALSKKIIFTLLRVRTLGAPLPPQIEKEFLSRLAEIKKIISPIALNDIQGINRHRYQIRGLEEYVEAASLYHYLRYQTLITPDQAVELLGLGLGQRQAEKENVAEEEEAMVEKEGKEEEEEAKEEATSIELTTEEYLGGVFDLFGEMMRFATNVAGLCGTLAPTTAESGKKEQVEEEHDDEEGKMDLDVDEKPEEEGKEKRTILSDMQELESCVEILPIFKGGKDMRWKMDTMRSSVQKVEKLGYGLVVRGSERPAGWMPDMSDDRGPEIEV